MRHKNYQIIKDAKRIAAVGPRGSGRTTAIMAAAASIGATVVMADERHGFSAGPSVPVIGIHRASNLQGRIGPVLWDHDAVCVVLAMAVETIEDLQSRIDSLTTHLETITAAVEG